MRPPDAHTVMPIKSNSIKSGKHTDKISMSRKYVSMSPARGAVSRSKSMNGLNRVDSKEKGRTQNHSMERVRISSSENGSPNIHNDFSNG